MAATVIIQRHTGAATGSPAVGTTLSDITSTTNRMSCSDSNAPGTATPIPIPTSSTNVSWWVSTRLNATVAPSNAINNLKWYSDGSSFGTGLTCVGNTAASATGYVQATGSATTGTALTTGNYAALSASAADVTTFTSGSPKSVTGSIAATTGGFGDFFVYQLQVGTSAGVGTSTARTLSWSFDET